MKTSLFSYGNNCIICHTRHTIMRPRGENVRTPCLFFYRFHVGSRENLQALVSPHGSCVAGPSGSRFRKQPVHQILSLSTQLWGDRNKKLRLAVAFFFFSSPGLSDINFSWLTVNQIALWAQFSFWFLVPELLIQNIKIRFSSELRSCIYNDKKFSLTETRSYDSAWQMRGAGGGTAYFITLQLEILMCAYVERD